jgi:hypothetical protein
MDKIKIKFYDSNNEIFDFMSVSNNDTIENIKKIFSKTKEVIAYDSFNKYLNIHTPLHDNTTLETLFERGFSKDSDYIIFEYK